MQSEKFSCSPYYPVPIPGLPLCVCVRLMCDVPLLSLLPSIYLGRRWMGWMSRVARLPSHRTILALWYVLW